MATNAQVPTRGSGPTFREVLDDNAPYIGALYLFNVVLFLAFVDLNALLNGRLVYKSLFAGETTIVSQFAAATFAVGFVVATLLAFAYASTVLSAREGGEIDPYALEERISAITVMPALQLFAVVLCPIVSGHSLAQGMKFIPVLLAGFF